MPIPKSNHALTQKIGQLQQNTMQLLLQKANVASVIISLNQLMPSDIEEITQRLESINSALLQLKKAPSDAKELIRIANELKQDIGFYDHNKPAIEFLADSSQRSTINDLELRLQAIIDSVDMLNASQTPTLYQVPQLATIALSGESRSSRSTLPSSGYKYQMALDRTILLLSAIDKGQPVNADQIEQSIQQAEMILSSLKSNVNFEQHKNLLTNAKQLQKEIITSIQNNTKYLKLLNEELEARDSSYSQYFINLRLTWAVFCMIGVILFAFAAMLYLGLKKESALVTLVKHRVAIEVIGLGFLLLTIIILGSGKLLAPEGTAALLGTIAGYIFVRKANDLAELSADTNSNPGGKAKNGSPNGKNPQNGDSGDDPTDSNDQQGGSDSESENDSMDAETADQTSESQTGNDTDAAQAGDVAHETQGGQPEPQAEGDEPETETTPPAPRKKKTVRRKATKKAAR